VKFYGSVTVSERGQIVIPSSARKDFGIEAGDNLLIIGRSEEGLVIMTSEVMAKALEMVVGLMGNIESSEKSPEGEEAKRRRQDIDLVSEPRGAQWQREPAVHPSGKR